jgi:ubiquinone biosynthesis protein
MEHLGPKGKTQRLLKDTKHYVHAWMQLPSEINAHFAQLNRRFPERQSGINFLGLLPILAVLLGGVLAGLFWEDAWRSPALLSSVALIGLGLWLQWRK